MRTSRARACGRRLDARTRHARPVDPASRRAGPSPVARRSPAICRFMAVCSARFFRRHMNALRARALGRAGAAAGAGPLVVYSQPSVLVGRRRLHPAGRGPLLARPSATRRSTRAMLKQLRLLRRASAPSASISTRRAAPAAFLPRAPRSWPRPDRALWITAQGRFADVRERPLGSRPGSRRLPELAPDCARSCRSPSNTLSGLERGAEACSPSAGRCAGASCWPCRARRGCGASKTALDRAPWTG